MRQDVTRKFKLFWEAHILIEKFFSIFNFNNLLSFEHQIFLLTSCYQLIFLIRVPSVPHPLSSTHQFQIKGPLLFIPKIPQFHTKNPSVQHTYQFHIKNPSVPAPLSSTPKNTQFNAPLRQKLCLTEEFLVWN